MENKKTNGGNKMIGRLLAPAFDKMSAIDLTDFVISIVYSEQAINGAIYHLKNGLHRDSRNDRGRI